jgi:uracil-DNA glycosylase family 4
MTRIFINYRRLDSEGYVGRLFDHLTRHFDAGDVFMDVDSIPPGADFVAALDAAVAACDVFIAVIGPQWLSITDETGTRRLDNWNDFVRVEIASALEQGKMVIPVLVGQAKMPAPSALPDVLAPLSRRNAIELSHHRFGYDAEKLIHAIKAYAPPNPLNKPKANAESLAQKAEAIKAVRLDLVGATASPLYPFRIESRAFPVIGEGSPDANILMIGEAPGRSEAETGRPFCGPSGDILDEMLKGIALKREDVFLTNILLDRPPEKRDPTLEEIAFYEPFVDRLVDIIQPGVIATLGRFAMEYIFKRLDLPEKRGKISQVHGRLVKTRMPYGEVHILPLYHPAVVLYSASQKETLRKDFEKLKLFI